MDGMWKLELSQIHENKIYLCNACIDGVEAKAVVLIWGMVFLNVDHEWQVMPCWGVYLKAEWQVCAHGCLCICAPGCVL